MYAPIRREDGARQRAGCAVLSLNARERAFLIALSLVTILGIGVMKAAARWPAWFPGYVAPAGRSVPAGAGKGRAGAPDTSRGVDDILREAPFSGRPTLLEAQLGRVAKAIEEDGPDRRHEEPPGPAGRKENRSVRSFAAPAPPPSAPIDPNRADAAALETIPGVGAVLAARIVADRGARGPFGRVADLERVPGIGPERLRKMARFLAIGGPDSARAPRGPSARPAPP